MGRRRGREPAAGAATSGAARRTRLLWTGAALAGAAAIYLGLAAAREAAYAARLPPLPDLADQTPAVREHLTEADRAARGDAASAGRVGALGIAYHADMFYDHADRSYRLAEDLDPRAWRWTYYRALVLGERGDAADAQAAALEDVVAAAPEFGAAWWRLGEAAFKAGRHERAEQAWRQARSLPEPVREPQGSTPRVPNAPLSAYASLGLARLALLRGDAEGARTMLEEVVAGHPRFGPAFRLLSDAYYALDRADDGERAVRAADRLPGYEPYIDPLVEALVQASRSTTFLLRHASTADVSTNAAWREHLARRALQFDPAHADALYELGTLYRVLRRYDEALEQLRRHQEVAPGDFQVIADIGRCLSGLRRFAEAEGTLRRALEGLDDANTRYDLGLVLDRTDRLAEAVAEYRRALERNPHHFDALNNLGVALVRQGRLADAAAQFERALAVNPDSADARANLGVVFLAQKNYASAGRAFRAALELSPRHPRALEGLQAVEDRR